MRNDWIPLFPFVCLSLPLIAKNVDVQANYFFILLSSSTSSRHVVDSSQGRRRSRSRTRRARCGHGTPQTTRAVSFSRVWQSVPPSGSVCHATLRLFSFKLSSRHDGRSALAFDDDGRVLAGSLRDAFAATLSIGRGGSLFFVALAWR